MYLKLLKVQIELNWVIAGFLLLLVMGGCDRNSVTNAQVLIGYDSLAIALGSKKSEIDKLVKIRVDKDNDDSSDEIFYYCERYPIKLNVLKANLGLYFDINKKDSTLNAFGALLTFDNYRSRDIMPSLKKELAKRFSKIQDFDSKKILNGEEQIKEYDGYIVTLKIDTALYSPTVSYIIETTK